MQIDILKGWSFRTDPSGQADWSAPSVDDSAWDVIDAGDFWQKQGYDGYSGAAWYRKRVDMPASWAGRQTYLVAGGVNDDFKVYVDGQPQGMPVTLPSQVQSGPKPTSTRVQLTAGKVNLLAIRVKSAFNFGGLDKAPLVLTTEPALPASLVDQAKQLAQAHPEGVWPGWMEGQGRDWTVVGRPEGGPESLEGPDGSWEATASAPAVSAWIVANGSLATPANAQWSLAEGHLPLVTSSWQAGEVQVSGLLWQEPGSVEWQLRLHNAGPAADLSVWVALRPYQVQPAIAPLYTLALNGNAVVANGRPALTLGDQPTRVLASTGEQGDLSVLAATRNSIDARVAEDGAGLASIALVYDLHLASDGDKSLAFAAPTGSAPAQIVRDPTATQNAWRDLLQPGAITVPDKRATDAYTASLAYILMSNDRGVLHPGPLLHDAFWYRDSTYELSALERNGNLAQVRQLLAPLTRFQAASGEFPANVSTHLQVGHPRGAPEWDSQGQGIHSLVEYYRFSHDDTWLRGVWPNVDSAARWLEQLTSIDGSGLLPQGESAEDLGPATDRHFWDDFWGVIGFRDAADAARAVGQADRAVQLQYEGDQLLAKTLAAGQPGLQRENGIFPNSPDSQQTPADARGTSPAVWPGQLLPLDQARTWFSG
ncbi:MAG: hypothetical protein JO247_04235, partial [Chloroflexi bacterium]|nr:hypothetical protein [Chloroflexota bacterium]